MRTFGTNLEWERFRYTLPKSKAKVEILREIVINDDDLEFIDISSPD